MASTRWTQADIDKTGLKVVSHGNKKGDVPRGNAEPKPSKSKYNNIKKDGFDSIHEWEQYKLLKLRQYKLKEITALQVQVTFHLSSCSYRADFVYFDKLLREWVVADAKGMKTSDYKIKKKMMFNELSITIKEI